jgi:hypothetical protein
VTLLTTEIHVHGASAHIVFAADRRISRGGRADGEAVKIFPVPGGNVGVGFFGLAEINGAQQRSMSSWLDVLVASVPSGSSPREVAVILLEGLRSTVPYDDAIKEPSGFHVSGFAEDGHPEFWYVRNVDNNGNPTRNGYDIREDFRGRDAGHLPAEAIQIYRNGDIRAHVAAWSQIDASLGQLLATPSFRQLTSIQDYVTWVRFKMELIARFYKDFSREQIIGGAIDCFALSRAA